MTVKEYKQRSAQRVASAKKRKRKYICPEEVGRMVLPAYRNMNRAKEKTKDIMTRTRRTEKEDLIC